MIDKDTVEGDNETREQLLGIRKSLIEANQMLHQASQLLEESGDTEFFHAVVSANAKLLDLDNDIQAKIEEGKF